MSLSSTLSASASEADSAIDQVAKPASLEIPITKEYQDSEGKKVTVSDDALSPESLSNVNPFFLKQISEVKEFQVKPFCSNCRFWNPISSRKFTAKNGKVLELRTIFTNGECRVNAPQSISPNDPAFFPRIGAFQWCGKYEKQDVQDPVPVPQPVSSPVEETPAP